MSFSDFGITRRSFVAAASGSVLLAAKTGPAPASYPFIQASGTHRELGRQHGEQAAGKIKAHVEKIASSGGYSKEKLRERTAAFASLFQKYCPHLLEEMHGLAEGAGISPAEALAVNIRGELGHAAQEGCTTYVIGRRGTSDHEILAGQNSDMDMSVPPLGYVLHLKPKSKPEILTWTFGGMICYHGVNSVGVAHFANALGGGPSGRLGLPHYPVKRMMLECDHVNQVVKIFETVPLASNGNYVLCDGHGNIADIEATTAGPEILKDHGTGFLAHTNHFVCSRYARAENFKQSWKDSFPRLDRMNSLVKNKFAALTVDEIKTFLSDHQGYPTSICRHDSESCTVASMISEPAQRRMHVAVGNPCTNRYTTYSM